MEANTGYVCFFWVPPIFFFTWASKTSYKSPSLLVQTRPSLTLKLDEPLHQQSVLVCPFSRWNVEHGGSLNPGLVKEGGSLWTLIKFPDIYRQTVIQSSELYLFLCRPHHLPSLPALLIQTGADSSTSSATNNDSKFQVPSLKCATCRTWRDTPLLMRLQITVGGLISRRPLMMFPHYKRHSWKPPGAFNIASNTDALKSVKLRQVERRKRESSVKVLVHKTRNVMWWLLSIRIVLHVQKTHNVQEFWSTFFCFYWCSLLSTKKPKILSLQ